MVIRVAMGCGIRGGGNGEWEEDFHVRLDDLPYPLIEHARPGCTARSIRGLLIPIFLSSSSPITSSTITHKQPSPKPT